MCINTVFYNYLRNYFHQGSLFSLVSLNYCMVSLALSLKNALCNFLLTRSARSFCLSCNVLVFPLIWKHSFAGCNIFSWQLLYLALWIWPSPLFLVGSQLKKLYFIYLFLERGEETEKEREWSIDVWEIRRSVASHTSSSGDLPHNPGMCPDWELNLRFAGQHSIHWATPARAGSQFLIYWSSLIYKELFFFCCFQNFLCLWTLLLWCAWLWISVYLSSLDFGELLEYID